MVGHAVLLPINVAYRILKIVTLSHFRHEKPWQELAKDVMRIVLPLFAYIGMMGALLYGATSLSHARDGALAHAAIEELIYDKKWSCIPIFHPREVTPKQINEESC